MFTHVFYVNVQRRQHKDKQQNFNLGFGTRCFNVIFFCLQSKTITPAQNNSDGSLLQRGRYCLEFPEELLWRARKMSRASPLGTVPRKTKRNETLQDKNNDKLLSERLKKKTNGFRNRQIEPSAFDTSNLTGCAPQPSNSCCSESVRNLTCRQIFVYNCSQVIFLSLIERSTSHICE